MNRTKLIWFAAGAFVSAIFSIGAPILIPKTEELRPYLSVSERPYREGEIQRIEEIASTSGQLLRECGAQEFFMKPSKGVDATPYSLLEISKPNSSALHCVFERSTKEGFSIYIQMLTDQQAQVY